MPDFRDQLKNGFYAGIKEGWNGFIWIFKILLPISFFIMLLQWTGWLDYLDFLFIPATNLLNLPPEAALPILAGILINIYAALAMLAIIPFTVGQLTLIAIFNLIAHQLVMEGIIQHKSGMNGFKIVAIRLILAIATVFVVSLFLGDTSQSVTLPAELTMQTPFLEVLKTWAIDTVILLAEIFGIIMFIMVVLESIKTLGWFDRLSYYSRPLTRLLGLSDGTAPMWFTATIFGVVYGGAVIVKEAQKSALTKEELECLHISIGVNHSMIEDPVLYMLLGINGFWLWIPRLIAAIAGVQVYRGINYIWRKFIRRKQTDLR